MNPEEIFGSLSLKSKMEFFKDKFFVFLKS